MVAEVFAGVSALKSAFDLARGLKDIDDAARRNSAVIDLQARILDAQSAQAELLVTNGELRDRIAQLESWDKEKARYALREIAPGIVCYVTKEEACNGEPIHKLCARCFADRQKGYLQQTVREDRVDRFTCDRCGSKLTVQKQVGPISASPRRRAEYF